MSVKIENSLEELYLKYRNKISRHLENDSYFQYMFELIKSGENVLQQTNRVLHKNIDEKWLTVIEDTIPDIDAIISHPRRFIATEENVVPIELARKIGAESVRHLAQNTKYMTDIKDGQVVPKKILNVASEEGFDLYENRFINTLIAKLASFINKRTDILFWSTGDERFSTLKLDSTVEDDYEEIKYKLEISIKSKQSYMETDTQNMEIFKRIGYIRHIVKEFQRSNFVELMKGTAQTKSPIQLTNLMMEDPHYKNCYALWTFLEGSDDVGYTIDTKETALDFDEEYLYQLYSNMLLNYTVFKSILSYDPRRIEDASPKHRKVLKPKFIKQIVEEFVDDYDIPDVEIRKVIIEEITKAQAEIEKQRYLKEKTAKEESKAREKARIAKEKAKEKERIAKEKAKEKARLEKEKQKAKEKERLAKEKAKEKERLAKEKEKAKEKERLIKKKAKEKERLFKEAAKAREKGRQQLEKAKEKERLAKEKAKEKERLAKEAELAREKERQQREKAKEKERLAKEAEKSRLAKELAKAKEKERLEAAKAKEKERLAKAKAKEQERLALAAAKAKEKQRLQREAAREKERLAKAKAKEHERLLKAAAKAREKERLAKEKSRSAKAKAQEEKQAKKSAKQENEKEEEVIIVEDEQRAIS